MQIEGEGFRVQARMFRALLAESPVLRRTLTRYAIQLGLQVAQTAACNRLHDVRQRLARWLLLAEDRLGTPTLPYHARLPGDDAGHGSSERKRGGVRVAAEPRNQLPARGDSHPKPAAAGEQSVRMLRSDPAVRW
jgi:hypothetical protein